MLELVEKDLGDKDAGRQECRGVDATSDQEYSDIDAKAPGCERTKAQQEGKSRDGGRNSALIVRNLVRE